MRHFKRIAIPIMVGLGLLITILSLTSMGGENREAELITQQEVTTTLLLNTTTIATTTIPTTISTTSTTIDTTLPPTTLATTVVTQAQVPVVVDESGWGACAIPQYICDRESGDNPTTNTGNGYYGRYQFLPDTWDNTVINMGRPDLVGVYVPAGVVQDQVAAFLWAGGAGCSHWNAC